MKVSIVIPVFNEAECIARTLDGLQQARGHSLEIIVVDGGSTDNTPRYCKGKCDQLLYTKRGRARQLNHGAVNARGDLLVFLHADTSLPDNAMEELRLAWRKNRQWGHFRLVLSGSNYLFRILEWFLFWRTRLTHVVTGDQAMFVNARLFNSIGGYPEIALMEDIAISKRLKDIEKPTLLHAKVLSSSRRWQQRGILRTIALMWVLRLQYFLGVSPEKLARQYE